MQQHGAGPETDNDTPRAPEPALPQLHLLRLDSDPIRAATRSASRRSEAHNPHAGWTGKGNWNWNHRTLVPGQSSAICADTEDRGTLLHFFDGSKCSSFSLEDSDGTATGPGDPNGQKPPCIGGGSAVCANPALGLVLTFRDRGLVDVYDVS